MIADEIVETAAIKAWCAPNARGDRMTPASYHNGPESQRDEYRNEARAVLKYAATLGPAREERLMRYRCAAQISYAGTGADPDQVESRAHRLLAAERPAEPETPREPSAIDKAVADVVVAYAQYQGNIEGPGARNLALAHESLRRLVTPEKGTDDAQ